MFNFPFTHSSLAQYSREYDLTIKMKKIVEKNIEVHNFVKLTQVNFKFIVFLKTLYLTII